MPGFLSGVTLASPRIETDADYVQTYSDPAALLIDLIADQVTAAVDEAFVETDALSIAFLTMSQHANRLLDTGDDTGSGSDRPHPLREALRDASIRLQFADRLHQRLSNVTKNLSGLAELVRTTEAPISDSAWCVFLQQTRATYTMEQERQMFDSVFSSDALHHRAVVDHE